MNRTRLLIVSLISIAALLVVATLVWRSLTLDPAYGGLGAARPQIVSIRVITALPVEPWVRAAADEFNAGAHEEDGVPIYVEIIAMDGLSALGKWERNGFSALPADVQPDDLSREERANLAHFPTAWIPDSRYLVALANASYKERLGRDVFLSDGQYRTRPVALSLFAWGFFHSRAAALQEHLGDISWATVHDASMEQGGWRELGGDPAWGAFKLAIPDPRRNAGGPAAMLAAAGAYYDRTNISVEDVNAVGFQTWLAQLMAAATDANRGNVHTAEDFALFGYTAGDGGLFLESDLLQNLQGILLRWQEPPVIDYPKFITWFDFPFTVWVGPESSALQKNAALAFQRFLLSEPQQRRALTFGLRPANPNVTVADAEDSLFVYWQKQGVLETVPRATAMRPPNRDLLLALLRWYELNIAP